MTRIGRRCETNENNSFEQQKGPTETHIEREGSVFSERPLFIYMKRARRSAFTVSTGEVPQSTQVIKTRDEW